MADTLTTLRAAYDHLCEHMLGSYGYCRHCLKLSPKHAENCSMDAVTNDLASLIASMEAQPEPVAWQERQSFNVGWSKWYYCDSRLPSSKTEMVVDHITYQWRPLYAQPSESKAEPACILCHGKGEHEMASAWLPGQPPQEKRMVKCNQCAQPKAEPARLTDAEIACAVIVADYNSVPGDWNNYFARLVESKIRGDV
jgi:hypothetical protein